MIFCLLLRISNLFVLNRERDKKKRSFGYPFIAYLPYLMTLHFGLQLLIVLGTIWVGMRMRGLGLGVMGATGVLLLTLFFHITPQEPSFKVLLVIIASITAASALEAAGSLEILTVWVERLLSRHPHYLVWLSPLLTYLLVFFMGTSHIIYPLLPVIVHVAQRNGIAPVKPLVGSVLASQQALLTSPVSVITTITLGQLQDVSGTFPLYRAWIFLIISTILGTLVATAVACLLCRSKFSRQRLAKPVLQTAYTAKPYAKSALVVFLFGVLSAGVCNYTQLLVDASGKPINPTYLVAMVMLAIAGVIFLCIGTKAVLQGRIFPIGMQAVVAVLGVTWLSKSFLNHYKEDFGLWMTHSVQGIWPWAILLFLVTVISNSQSATIEAILPHALQAIGAASCLAILPAANSFYVLPSYPTILAAITFDKTGSTRVGRWVFNHSFLIPGFLGTWTTVLINYWLHNYL